MVFSQLSPNEKDAFFGLLDEYFASRPELFKNSSPGTEGAAAAAAVQKAFASPVGRATAQEAVKSLGSGWNSRREPSPTNPSANEEQSSSIGRVAAAAAALSSSSRFAGASPSGAPPIPPPRGASNAAETSDAPSSRPSLPGSRNSTIGKLIPTKSFGDVDMSSGKNMFNSLRHSTANKSIVHPPPAVAPAFTQKKNQFAPPPTRRVPANVSADHSPPPAASAPPPPPRPRAEEEEPEGEWAEALYDYSSEDPGDLQVKESQRVLILEKSSEDWWTGELNGRRGLVPAAYVKIV